MSISDLDDYISHVLAILSSLPQTHPRLPALLQAMALAHHDRYVLSDQKEDIDRSVLYLTRAIFFALPCMGTSEGFIAIFASLSFGLFRRSLHFKHSSSVEYVIKYLRCLQHLPLETVGVSRDQVGVFLVLALGLQVEMGSGDVSRDVDEMTILCRELLDSDFVGEYLADIIATLSNAIDINLDQSPEPEPSEEVIECLRKATRRIGSHYIAYSLAWLLVYRFRKTYSLQDYEEATALVDEIIASHSRGDCPGSCVEPASEVSAILAAMRYDVYKKPQHREEAIDRCRTFLSIASTNNSLRLHVIPLLTDLVQRRSLLFGVTDNLQACSSNPQVDHLPSFSRLTASLAKSTAVKSLRSISREEVDQYLQALVSTCRATDIANIEDAIKFCRQFLASLPPGDSFAHRPAFQLGELLFRAFECTDKIECLNESITVLRGILVLPGLRCINFDVAQTLIWALHSRFSLFHLRDDMDEIMHLYPIAAKDTLASARSRFELSYQWAHIARVLRHPSTLTAYKTAISLMHDSLMFAPTLETQHFSLIALRNAYQKLPLDLASYQINKGRLKQAIESLERGRAFLWSEMRGFRASIDQLSAVDPPLAKEFTAVNQKLETLTMSVTPAIAMDGGVGSANGSGMDSFGRLVARQQKLVAERYELISRIQALPGFRNFLKTHSFDTLRSAAARGPVIIINHPKWRSDNPYSSPRRSTFPHHDL